MSNSPGVHPPSPPQVSPPQLQSIWHVCSSVPHAPHGPPLRVSPGVHSPLVHAPSLAQRPSRQTCRCMPQRSQSIIRGGSPGSQLHSAGALHASHTPFSQRSTPVPHALVHVRSATRPRVGSLSSQSTSAGTPSSSMSTPGSMHRPSMHTIGDSQRGVHASASVLPPSVRGVSMSPPSAHAIKPNNAKKAHLQRMASGILARPFERGVLGGSPRRSGRAVEGGGLENRSWGNSTGGSNPSSSAIPLRARRCFPALPRNLLSSRALAL